MNYTKNLTEKIEDRLLATHISDNPKFESACLSGDGLMIMNIVETEMENNNLYTIHYTIKHHRCQSIFLEKQGFPQKILERGTQDVCRHL